ncbi:DUF1638 domain-containing protein [Phaeobacter sp. CNT1-3]|jgi:hypothetical protein|nr:DUF1638 domain-containing protein [Phaeobacter sp. CNT1-3]
MTQFDDSTLTSQTLPPLQGEGRVLIIACGALAREILALKEMNGWDHLDLTCLPAILHNHPEKIADAARDAIAKHRDAYGQIFMAYADCGTGGALEAVCRAEGVEMIAGPHCYSFFTGNEAFEAAGEVTSFFLTDFLARQFETFVVKPLGLDRHPDLASMYFGNYEKLIYLAQTDDPALTAKAEEAAETLGLAFERRMTGYGDLATALAALKA